MLGEIPRKQLVFLTGWMTVIATTGFCQAGIGQSQSKQLAFEVISIKQNKSGAQGGHIDPLGDGYSQTNTPLFMLISNAYGFITAQDRIVGAPNWVKDDRYDIQAKVSGSDAAEFQKMPLAQLRQMYQALLEDRLKLKVHLEPRNIPAYALVIAKNGPRLRTADASNAGTERPKAPDGSTVSGTYLTGPGQITSLAGPIGALAAVLGRNQVGLGRPVLDQTGLTGEYDFVLHWTPDIEPSQPQSDGRAPVDADSPAIFTALQEQLGLRLEPISAPQQFLVIDHIERPSEN